MPRYLTEKYVQRKAVEWLASEVLERDAGAVVVSRLEVRLKSDPSSPGHGRADGLVAARLSTGDVRTRSLEAKSRRTQHNLRGRPSALGNVTSVAVALLAAIVSRWLVAPWSNALWLWSLLPLAAFLAAFIIMRKIVATRFKLARRQADVVRQSLRYPANERWIAVSRGAYKRLDPDDEPLLRASCERHGIGLLVVNRRGDVRVLLRPTTCTPRHEGDDWLDCYCAGQAIRLELNAG